MVDILQKIIARKHEEIAQLKQIRTEAELRHETEIWAKQYPSRDFLGALKAKRAQNQPAIIAEIKKASPSKGIIRADFDPEILAKQYADHGAACLSVLTDRDFFQGDLAYLNVARSACELPILRKDFTVSSYQIYEARRFGADAILLIAAALDDAALQNFEALALELGLAVLVEVHDLSELERALKLQSPLIGINNRNLRTFEVSLQTSTNLLPHFPADKICVAESGLHSPEDIRHLQNAGIHHFLIGEAFMKQEHAGKALAQFMQNS